MTEPVTEPGSDGAGLRWATHDRPDLLVVQPAPVPAVSGGRPVDVLRLLFERRGFVPVAQDPDGAGAGLRPASGCLVAGGDDPALLVTVSDEVGATRFALPGLDAGWWERVRAAGHAVVAVSTTAVADDGTTTRDALRADAEAGGLLAALVPTGIL